MKKKLTGWLLKAYPQCSNGMRGVVTLLLSLCLLTVSAQETRSLTDSLHYRVEMQGTLSHGDHNPLWLNANRYGLSSLETSNGYLRGAVERPLCVDSARRWGIGYCVDAAVAAGFTSTLVVQQAYMEARWLKGVLTAGAKEYPMELKNPLLSTGSQTFGINARPIPQVRLALPDYWALPYTKGWVSLKGHLAYGMQTDGRWQEDFTHGESRYVEHALFHSKAGYLRIGRHHVTLELGLEMGCQFGGTSHLFDTAEKPVVKNPQNLRAFYDALFGSGADATDSHWSNTYGNQLGSYVARLNLDYEHWNLGLYADHFFEDHSGMFFLDYDGYGSGTEWDTKKDSRYFRYDLKDVMLGVELTLKTTPWLNNIVLEYLYTKYQSGPVYHDHTQNISDHISGRDNYYNHNMQTGWQHWGMVMGNALYMSPLYNDDGQVQVRNNRFVAWHLGLKGCLSPKLSYRLLTTWQRGYGTYDVPFDDPRETVSLLAEAVYTLPKGGWQVKSSFGLDAGALYGDNYGLQLSVVKTGLLRTRKEERGVRRGEVISDK